jgi:hypothetical protein
MMSAPAAEAGSRKNAALLRIIRIAAGNPILSDSFRSPAILQVLIGLLLDTMPDVQDELWWTISVITCRANVGSANAFIEPAVACFVPLPQKIGRSQIFAVEFLARMLELRAISVATTIDGAVQKAIVGLVDRFPDSAELMGAAFRFIRGALLWELTMPETIGTFVPTTIAIAAGSMRTSAFVRARLLLVELERERSTFPELDEALMDLGIFSDFCKDHLMAYVEMLGRSYGCDSSVGVDRLARKRLHST